MSPGEQEAAAQPPSRTLEWLAVLASPLVWVLLLAAFFDGVSDNWVHAALLCSVAVVVARDAMVSSRGVELPRSEALFAGPPARRATLAFAVGALGYASVAGAWIRYSWPDTLAILVPGIAALLVAWRGSVWPRDRATKRLNPQPWVVVLVALALWELAALLSQPNLQTDSREHPTISVLMDPVLASHVGRSVSLLLWLLAGWYVLRRVPARPPEGDPS